MDCIHGIVCGRLLPELLPAPAYGTIDRLTGKLDRQNKFLR